MINKRRAALESAIYDRVAPVVEAMLFPPTLNDVAEGMGNTSTGVEARVTENMLELHAVACDAGAARRALGLGAREANLLAERLSLPLEQEMPISTMRHNETGSEYLAVTRYRLAESAAWPGSAPDGWEIAPGPVVERIEGDDRGRIVYHGHAIRPHMLYIYPGGTSTPTDISTFNSAQEAADAFGPMLRQAKAKASESQRQPGGRATEATKRFADVGLRELFFYKGSTYFKWGKQAKGGKLVNARLSKGGRPSNEWAHFKPGDRVSTLRDPREDDPSTRLAIPVGSSRFD